MPPTGGRSANFLGQRQVQAFEGSRIGLARASCEALGRPVQPRLGHECRAIAVGGHVVEATRR